ncbi:hypothetical protein Ae201684_004547 [Aphanomyces euteiches]|uniref:Uncharacterized protein n=1 Tax=Aphanomyces euteiches TaxID=100861 RepID=A0A6G0XIN6_9STRA|nr:hypothetical protein Ae201684_004547 [Aphanomyces euteiches]
MMLLSVRMPFSLVPKLPNGSLRINATLTRLSDYSCCTGNSKTTSLEVNFLYTVAKVSNLVSTFTWSLGSKKTLRSLEPSRETRVRLPTISVG